jgi:tetratricopeptide (TPR) repeat protein
MLQYNHFYLGNYNKALSWQEPAQRTLRQDFDLRWYSWSLGVTSLAYSTVGRFTEALEQSAEEIRVAEEYQDNSLLSFSHMMASYAYFHRGDFDRAIENAEIAVAKAPTVADKVWVSRRWVSHGRVVGMSERRSNCSPGWLQLWRPQRTWQDR